ncbi:hypothetical protein CBL_05420 [Carabus blaptoides fortunei]
MVGEPHARVIVSNDVTVPCRTAPHRYMPRCVTLLSVTGDASTGTVAGAAAPRASAALTLALMYTAVSGMDVKKSSEDFLMLLTTVIHNAIPFGRRKIYASEKRGPRPFHLSIRCYIITTPLTFHPVPLSAANSTDSAIGRNSSPPNQKHQ